METETIIHLILNFFKPFLSPLHAYDFFIEVFSKYYFINDYLILEKETISLAIVMLLYIPLLWFFLWLFIKIVKYLLEIIENGLIHTYFLFTIAIVATFLSVIITMSFLFIFIPNLIKSLFN